MENIVKLLAIFTVFIFSACSDYAGDIEDNYNERLETGAIKCDDDIDGMQISTIDGGIRVCQDGEWIINTENFPSPNENSSSSSGISSSSKNQQNSSSSILAKSSSSVTENAVDELYKCPDGSYAIDYENCEKKNCTSYSGNLVCMEDVESLLGICTTEIVDSIGLVNKIYFKCNDSLSWSAASKQEVDTYHWENGDDGEARLGEVNTNICYVYDTSATYSGWIPAENRACSLGIGGCTVGKSLETQKANDGVYYMCQNRVWTTVDQTLAQETWTEKCDVDGKTMYGLVSASDLYVCDNESWRLAEISEYTYGPCTKGNQDSFSKDYSMYCNGSKWRTTTEVEKSAGKVCNSTNLGLFTILDNGKTYVCPGTSWRIASCAEQTAQSLCNDSVALSANKTVLCPQDSLIYICKSDSWVTANFYDFSVPTDKIFNTDIVYGTLVDERDGRSYKTLTIQTEDYEAEWMAENLKYADSTNDTYLTGNTWCYNNDSSNCSIVGRLYSWTATVSINQKYATSTSASDIAESLSGNLLKTEHQGVCPAGWHVPSSNEWEYLYSAFGNNLNSLMSKADTTNAKATNESGFSLLPGIYAYSNFEVQENCSGCTYIRPFLPYINHYWAKDGLVILESIVVTPDIFRDLEDDGQNYYDAENPISGYPVRCVKNCSNCKTPSN